MCASGLAPVNKLIPFSLVDGPGSRCSVFLQGCNIACVYCHNPETQKLCCNCGICVESCPVAALSIKQGRVVWNKERCITCDTCIKVCPHRASPKIWHASAQEVFEQAVSYKPFIRGITVSGGECMLHHAWLSELFALCRGAGLSCLIDSNGTIAFENYPELMNTCDGVMLDVKAWDEQVAEHLTGQSAELSATVKQNLRYLAHEHKLEEIRIVVLDGWGDPADTIRGIAQAIPYELGEQRLKLIRFRNFGVRGELATAASPSSEIIASLKELALETGFKEVVTT